MYSKLTKPERRHYYIYELPPCDSILKHMFLFDPFQANVAYLYPLKISKTYDVIMMIPLH